MSTKQCPPGYYAKWLSSPISKTMTQVCRKIKGYVSSKELGVDAKADFDVIITNEISSTILKTIKTSTKKMQINQNMTNYNKVKENDSLFEIFFWIILASNFLFFFSCAVYCFCQTKKVKF